MSSNNEQHLDIDPCDIDEDQNAAIKIADMEAKYEKEIANMNAKLDLMALEKDAAVAVAAKALAAKAEAGAGPGSDKKKVNWTAGHLARHDSVVLAAAPALLALKQLQNNHDAIWWCAKHIEALGVGDKPDWHDSYKKWAADHKTDALEKYIPFV
jgi:hypothetical protein